MSNNRDNKTEENGAEINTANQSVYPLLPNEEKRLASLQSYHILDTIEEKDFDDLTNLASVICQTPIALVSLVDQERQWFKSHKGLPATETPRDYSFCAHAIASPEHAMIVHDATQDHRFSDNPLVTGETNIVFYAGVPLVNNEGFALGTLCVIDHRTRELSAQQIDALTIVARQVIDKLELKKKINEAESSNKELFESYEAIRLAHEQLNQSETRFRQLVDHAPVAIAILRGPDLLIESANEQILKIWNKDRSIIDLPLAVAIPELEGQPFLSLLIDVLRSGKVYQGTEAKVSGARRGALKDSFFNFVYQPLKDEIGITHSIMVVATEITDQVDARKAVLESNERLNLALDAGNLGSYDLNIDTGIMSCTAQFKKNYGLSTDSVFSFSNLIAAIIPEFRDYVLEQLNAAVRNNTIYTAEYQVLWPNGELHWISASGKPQFDEESKSMRIVGVTQNITERKAFEQKKDDFLGIVSHELKTPITSLKGNLQLMERIDPSHEKFPRLVDSSNRSINKINALVDDLLNMHRINEGQLKLEKTKFNIGELLQNTCSHIRVNDMHELITEGDKSLEMHADEHRIEQVIVNYVNNAVKYAPESRDIFLSANKEGSFIKVAVRDTGRGIPSEHLPHLFDRYWRADHSGAKYSGLGLGLYICSEIIKRHGGRVGVDSELGKGSTFWFTIPCAPAAVS